MTAQTGPGNPDGEEPRPAAIDAPQQPTEQLAPDSAADVSATMVLPPVGDADSSPAEPATEHLPVGTALLVVRRGPNAGSRFLLEQDLVTAGRHPDSDIFLDDVTVSRRHAQFVSEGDGFRVKDVGSLNGTYVNRARIEDVRLAGGDEVQIGKYRLTYLAPPAGEPGP